MIIISACGPVPPFVDLPLPVHGKYPTMSTSIKVGDTQMTDLDSPLIAVTYHETHKGPGGVRKETFLIKQSDVDGIMLTSIWGDIAEGEVRVTSSYDPDGNIVEGRVTLKLNKASLFQWFKGCLSCTLNQGRLIISYISPTPGADPIIDSVYYMEETGTSSSSVLAMGAAAKWTNVSDLFPQYLQWGFWETYKSTDMVISALYAARDALQNVPPTIKVVDEDGTKEIIGRQTGLKIYTNGNFAGTIVFTYKNGLGHMPNTELIGKGSLSRIQFNFGDVCQTISVIDPPVGKSFSTLFVFADCSAADQIENTDAITLYELIRSGANSSIHFGIYSNGYVGDVNQPTSDGSVKVGEGGGVFYTLLGEPSLSDLINARNLISMMGRGGVDASGFGYATETLSGNGIEYFLGTMILSQAPVDQQFRVYGFDPGLLDRSGFLNIPEYEQK